MIQITIEKVAVIKDEIDTKDMSKGRTGKADKWERTTIYTQLFETEPDIIPIIKISNRRCAVSS